MGGDLQKTDLSMASAAARPLEVASLWVALPLPAPHFHGAIWQCGNLEVTLTSRLGLCESVLLVVMLWADCDSLFVSLIRTSFYCLCLV